MLNQQDEALRLALHGVRLDLYSDSTLFRDYASSVFKRLLVEDSSPPDLLSRLTWCEGKPPRSPREVFGLADWERQPDRDLYLKGGQAWWMRIDDFANLKLHVDASDIPTSLEGKYYFRLGDRKGVEWLRRLRYRRRLDALMSHRFSTLAYYLFYHPVLWRLSRQQGWHVLHGGAVRTPSGTALLTGMPGCGKSTLAVSMLGVDGSAMLSDNLLLYNASQVLACPETVLLDSHSLALAGSGAQKLVATGEGRVFARDGYVPAEIEMNPCEPAAIFSVERGSHTLLERFDASACVERMFAGNTMAQEVRRIGIMGEVLDLAAKTSAPDARADAEQLASRVPCFRLQIGPEEKLEELVMRLIVPAMEQPGG